MNPPRFHLDEDAESHSLVRALRDRGVDVTTTSEAGLAELSDEAQLSWAATHDRVLVTYNVGDFARLHARWLQAGRGHAGLVLMAQQRDSVGETMRRLLRLRAALTAEALRNRCEFLSHW